MTVTQEIPVSTVPERAPSWTAHARHRVEGPASKAGPSGRTPKHRADSK